jgi:hypothetical protein
MLTLANAAILTGGEPSSHQVDELLDERAELTGS